MSKQLKPTYLIVLCLKTQWATKLLSVQCIYVSELGPYTFDFHVFVVEELPFNQSVNCKKNYFPVLLFSVSAAGDLQPWRAAQDRCPGRSCDSP